MGPLYVASLYAAGVIGAGFASGKELVLFFLNFGWPGLVGIFVASAFMAVGAAQVLEFCSANRLDSYRGLLTVLGPRSRAVFDWVYSGFLLVGVGVMLAGMADMGATAVSRILLRWGGALLVMAILRKGASKALVQAVWLAPAILLFLLGTALLTWGGKRDLPPASWRGLESGLLYGSYNLGFSMALLASVHHFLKTKGQRRAAALLGNIFLGSAMLLLVLRLAALPVKELRSSFPLLYVASGLGSWAGIGYKIILWISMYTTALANCLALVTRITADRRISWLKAGALVLGGGLALSFFGFTNLIKAAYPLLGLAGLYLLIHVFRAQLTSRRFP